MPARQPRVFVDDRGEPFGIVRELAVVGEADEAGRAHRIPVEEAVGEAARQIPRPIGVQIERATDAVPLARALVDGGLPVLEITTPRKPPLSTFYRVWFDRVVPRLGRVLPGGDYGFPNNPIGRNARDLELFGALVAVFGWRVAELNSQSFSPALNLNLRWLYLSSVVGGVLIVTVRFEPVAMLGFESPSSRRIPNAARYAGNAFTCS